MEKVTLTSKMFGRGGQLLLSPSYVSNGYWVIRRDYVDNPEAFLTDGAAKRILKVDCVRELKDDSVAAIIPRTSDAYSLTVTNLRVLSLEKTHVVYRQGQTENTGFVAFNMVIFGLNLPFKLFQIAAYKPAFITHDGTLDGEVIFAVMPIDVSVLSTYGLPVPKVKDEATVAA